MPTSALGLRSKRGLVQINIFNDMYNGLLLFSLIVSGHSGSGSPDFIKVKAAGEYDTDTGRPKHSSHTRELKQLNTG